MQNIRKSVFGAILGLALAGAFGFGATQLQASVAASAKSCETQVCPAQSACPMGGAAKTSAADHCPMSKGSSI